MYAIACACCCAAMAGRVVAADIDIDVGRGGSWLISYFMSNGGGGKPSVTDGELELPRARVAASVFESEGENSPRAGFKEFVHGCGVFPLPIPMGVKPVESGGQAKLLLYDGIPPWLLLLLRPFRVEESGLRLSPGTVDGGVKS